MSLPYQIEETIPEGEVLQGGEEERKYTTMCIFTSAHKHTGIHWRDMELSSADKQMTDK